MEKAIDEDGVELIGYTLGDVLIVFHLQQEK